MQKDHQWVWGPPQQKAFEEIKSTAPVLALYDPNKETKISADASSFGFGAVLLQRQDAETWRPLAFISRALTPVECRYAQIEKEDLALTWACERCSDYIVGKSIIAETDHKPLSPRVPWMKFLLQYSGSECISCVFTLKSSTMYLERNCTSQMHCPECKQPPQTIRQLFLKKK